MTSSLRPRLAFICVCMIWALTLPLFAQEIPGVPPESEYYYRIHYEKVEKIILVADLADREKQLTDFMKSVNPKSKILQFMPSFFTQIAEEYKKAGKADQAKALLGKIVQWFPNSVNPMTAIAQAFQAKDYAKTAELGEAQYATNPQKDLAFILFSSYAATNNGPKAAGYAAKVVEGFGPKDGINSLIWLTHYHANQKNADKAAEYGEMMQKAYPDSNPPGMNAEQWNAERAFSCMIQGASSYAKKEYPDAVNHYTESLKYYPKNDEAHFQTGMSHWRFSAGLAAADDAAKQKAQDQAIDAFAKATVIGKARAAKAREYLELLYKPRHNNTLDGLDALLAKAKAEAN